MCLLHVGDVIKTILMEAHNLRYSIYSGAIKMYHDLRQRYWWGRMKRDIMEFIALCLNCQQVKYEHQRMRGTL